MPNLHAHYHHGNLKAFRQELEAAYAGSSSTPIGGGKAGSLGKGSWKETWHEGKVKADPNERDAFGRTVLHLAASSLSPLAYSFLTHLIKNPNISINLQDYESGYTALHRALFAGNIKAARDLLLRHDVDLSIKDHEGMTAFELYNGTVDGTSPPEAGDGTDLYVWGVNRNFVLGTGDSNDKTYADRVNLLTQNQASGRPDPAQRFFHVGVKDVVMSKLHTGVVTTESKGNLSVCGFGSNGRLGRNVHSQLALLPMSDFPHSIISVALGQDHTLALSSSGYILSWGHNRFSQLGYPIEQPEKPVGMGKDEIEVQVSPKRIVGALKKEFVKGVAAGRMASACWTADSVYTWGTNTGHLGYDKATNPVQVVPRKVTAISQPVVDVALSDYAMVCLLDTMEVVCLHHDAHFKISFSTPRILSDAFPFQPPQSTLRPAITKVTSNGGTTFAALSSIGDVFTFSLPNPLEDTTKDARDRHVTVKPQLIWALRKRFTAVRDVCLGSDGTVIICTSSGHVFVRQRVKTGSGQLKFRRVPYLQRIIKVGVNESGAFAAVRVEAKATPITLKGRTLEEDMLFLQPHFRRFENQMTAEDFDRARNTKGRQDEDDDEEDEGSNSVTHDIAAAVNMCTILSRWRKSDDSLFSWNEALLGSDISFDLDETSIPAHSTILSIRVPALQRLVFGGEQGKIPGFKLDGETNGMRRIKVDVCHPLVILLLLQYIYSDEIAAVWDPRVARILQDRFPESKLPIAQIKSDLQRLATTLDISPLITLLASAGKSANPHRTLSGDLQTFFSSTFSSHENPSSSFSAILSRSCDTTLIIADKSISCSSSILRSRCPFFEAMFGDDDWIKTRYEDGGERVVVRMPHLKWRPMRLVFKYIHGVKEDDLFDYLHQETLDEFLDFVFEVLAAATELLLDRLVLICSRVIIRHCNAFNAAALACEASFYRATTLKLSIFDYIISCMETMLESGLLDEMEEDVLQELCGVIGQKQSDKLSVPRTGLLVSAAMERNKEWIAMQDIPVPRVRQPYKRPAHAHAHRSPRLSPVDLMTLARPPAIHRSQAQMRARGTPSPMASPEIQPVRGGNAGPVDDIFSMDEDAPTPSASTISNGAHTPRSSRPMTPIDLGPGVKGSGAGAGAVWKSRTIEAERVDLRSIMAETAATKRGPTPSKLQPPSAVASSSSSSTPISLAAPGPRTLPSSGSPSLARSPPSSGSPWRKVESAITTTVPGSNAAPRPSSPAISNFGPPPGRPSQASQPSPVPQRQAPIANAKVITPSRMVPGATPSIARKTSTGSPWSAVTSFAPPPPPTVPLSPTTQSFSLLAIQQQEQDLLERSKKPAIRSFADILEEEQKEEAAKVKEVEFMRWWEEEEAKRRASGSGSGSTGPGAKGGKRNAATGEGSNSTGKARGGQARRATARGRGRGGAGGSGRAQVPEASNATGSTSTSTPATPKPDRRQQPSTASPSPAASKAKPPGGGPRIDSPRSGISLSSNAPAFHPQQRPKPDPAA